MHPRSSLIIRVLMNRFHQGAPSTFLAGLSSEDAKKVLDYQITSQEAFQAIRDPESFIKMHIHYSWLLPVIKTFSTTMQPLLASSLPPEMAIRLGKLLGTPLIELPSFLSKQFLIGTLFKKCQTESILPIAFLPETILIPLLPLTKNELIELIDLLGIYDLAEEMRLIIDKKILQNIYTCLPEKKLRFLRTCLHQKEKITAASLGLKKWKGDGQELDKMLHQRGLLRLGYVLSGQHPDFVWYITHRLDSGRGNILEKNYLKKEIAGVTPVLIQQVLNIINFLKRSAE